MPAAADVPQIEPKLTIAPPPWRRIGSSAARHMKNVPSTLTRNCDHQAASDVSSAVARTIVPAALTSPSRRPCRPAAVAIASVQNAESETSPTSGGAVADLLGDARRARLVAVDDHDVRLVGGEQRARSPRPSRTRLP